MKLIQRLSLCFRILRAKPGNLLAHALRELPKSDDDMQALMNQQMCELILVFSTHGHSGFSASYATALVGKLLKYEPLGPLTGEADEWIDHGGGSFQNRRCSHVFKNTDRFDGQAYDINGIVWEEPDGGRFTNGASMVPVTFPYTPTTEYRPRPSETAAPQQEQTP